MHRTHPLLPTLLCLILGGLLLATAVAGLQAQSLEETLQEIRDPEANHNARRAALGRLGREVSIEGHEAHVQSFLVAFLVDPGGPPARFDFLRGTAGAVIASQFGDGALPLLNEVFVDPETGESVTIAYVRIGGPAVATLVGYLGHDHPMIRARAARTLGAINRPAAEAVPALATLINDSDPQVRIAAVDALASIGQRRHPAHQAIDGVREPLVAALADADPQVRRTAILGLATTAPFAGEATTDLVAMLDDEDPQLRVTTVQTLAAIGPNAAQATAALSALAMDAKEDAFMRQQALVALASIADVRAVASLLTLLPEDDDPLRLAALQALAAMPPQAVDLLLEAATSDNERIRRYVIYLLGEIGGDSAKALPVLIRATADRSPAVRRNAVDALGRVDTQGQSVEQLRGALKDSDPLIRRAAARSLGLIGQPASQAAGELATLLREGSSADQRWAAATALGRIGASTPAAIAALVAALDDNNEAVRWAAAQSLVAIGQPALAAVQQAPRTSASQRWIDYVIAQITTAGA